MRRLYIVAIVLGLVLFLAISSLLARVFSVDGAERSALTELVRAEARGDAAGMVARIHGCAASEACTARVNEDAAALRRPGTAGR